MKEMMCEVCGGKNATTRSKVDGLQLAVCVNCVKFGSEVLSRSEVSQRKTTNLDFDGEDILPNYAEKLRRAREEKRLSFEELAKLLFEKKSVVEKVESGKMLPDLKLTKKLEKFFGIKIKGIIDSKHDGHKKNLPKATLGDLVKLKTVKR
ncbi:MAG: TIGR00270 family protein [Candidatus Altiarchaeota archaeon]|nr:TIGR00270 family protein [Candidatus Altiarchaeota archaeon]